jgi:hypothetical protein
MKIEGPNSRFDSNLHYQRPRKTASGEQQHVQSQKKIASGAGLIAQAALGTSSQGSTGDFTSKQYSRPPRR